MTLGDAAVQQATCLYGGLGLAMLAGHLAPPRHGVDHPAGDPEESEGLGESMRPAASSRMTGPRRAPQEFFGRYPFVGCSCVIVRRSRTRGR